MTINAREAMDGAGRIDITVRPASSVPPIRSNPEVRGRFVAISMKDTGAGIAPDQLKRIFEPFFTTNRVGEGTGLELRQVFGFVKRSGGDIAVASQVDNGTMINPVSSPNSKKLEISAKLLLRDPRRHCFGRARLSFRSRMGFVMIALSTSLPVFGLRRSITGSSAFGNHPHDENDRDGR